VRREAGGVAAVILAVVGILAPMTLAGRLSSAADLTAFYVPATSRSGPRARSRASRSWPTRSRA
jgi:hypothetical protein